MAATSSSTWTSWREALKVVSQPSQLKKTAALAFVIGTIFFAINQLGQEHDPGQGIPARH